jgi:hypothetical protein
MKLQIHILGGHVDIASFIGLEKKMFLQHLVNF